MKKPRPEPWLWSWILPLFPVYRVCGINLPALGEFGGGNLGVGSGIGIVFASHDDSHGERTADVRRQSVCPVCDRRAAIPASGLVVASETASPDCRYGYVRFWGVLIRSTRCLPSNSSGRRWNRWFHPCFFDEKTAQSKTCDNPLGGGADSASIVTISRVRPRTFLDLA